MSKVLKDAALVVGIAAIVVATAGTGLLGAGAATAVSSAATAVGGAVGLASATASTLAAGLGIAAAAASFASGALAKKPGNIGSPMTWQSDPQAGIPIIWGRMYSGGKIILRSTSDQNNRAESIHTVYSIGPIKGFEGAYLDGVLTGVDANGNAQIADYGKIVITTQLGRQPEPGAFGFWDSTPGLDSSSKISGLAASAMRLYYDTKGGHTLTTEPQFGYVVEGVRVYDPRKDDTYPGGSGPQRWNDETTWSYVGYDNPYLFGLTWLIGWRMNGKLVAGVGARFSSIIVSQFVEGANVADANGWKGGGTLDTTDSKWQRLKDILLAGGGEPIKLGAQIGVLINTPRVSLATIGVGDVVGAASVQATQPMRDRINAIVPRFMAEQSVTTQNSDGSFRTAVTWGMVPASPIVIDDYVAFDGKQRQKQIDYEFVQGVANGANAPNQVAQLARYAIENAREFGPITLPLKLRWMGYKPGDVVTANLPELGLNGQDILLLNRSLEADKGTVTMTARSETFAKHAFALGQTTTAPATPGVSGPALIPVPGNTAWTVTGGQLVSDNGASAPALFLVGAVDSDVIDAIVVEYRQSTGSQDADQDWIAVTSMAPNSTGVNIANVKDQTAYQVAVSYRKGAGTGSRLILGPVTAGQTQVPWDGGISDPGGTKPQDKATVGAPAGTEVGGVPAEQVIEKLSSIQQQVDDINSGDSGSAEQAAEAAEAAQHAAENAQANAQTAASQAQDAYTAADQARQTAANAAGAASTYADGAASSASLAGMSASAAHESEVSATLAGAQLFPSDLNANTKWEYGLSGSPEQALAYAYDASYFIQNTWDNSVSYTNGGGFLQVATIGLISAQAGRTYDIEVQVNGKEPDKNGAANCISNIDFVELDESYTVIGYAAGVTVAGYDGAINNGGAFGLQTQKVRYTRAAGDAGVYLRPRWYGNWNGGSGTTPNMHYALNYFRVTDVTELVAAQAAAAAAATSSSNAAASQTAAGNSASASQQSATDAATQANNAYQQAYNALQFAGQASTSASNASTSESNAAGSASTASSYAQQAASSRDQAGGYANAAATSASTAQSASDSAGSSATSASASANAASASAGNAVNSANSSNSSAASASSSAAAAQQSAAISASVGAAFLNGNGNFGAYTNSPGVPDLWSDWSYGATGTRAAGQAGSYAYRSVVPAGQSTGLFQDIYIVTGDYVIEADLWCEAGDFSGVGIHLDNDQHNVSIADLGLATDADMGNTIGVTGPGIRRWRKFVSINYTGLARFYLMSGWIGFGDVTAKTVAWYRAGIRPASAAESAGKKAAADSSTALAQIAGNASAQASVNSAQSSINSQLDARIGDNAGQISQTNTTVANNYSSLSQSISNVSSSVGSLSSTVSTQAQTLADITSNKLKAFWQVLVDVGGSGQAGVVVSAQKADGTTTSDVSLYGQSFSFWNPAAGDATDPAAYTLGMQYENGVLRVYGKVIASNFITDQGVDIAAVVPGSLNWKASGSQDLGNTTIAAGASFGPAAGTGLVALNGQRVTPKISFSYAGGSPGTGPEPTVKTFSLSVYLASNTNGAGWVYTQIGTLSSSGTTVKTANFTLDTYPPGNGSTQFAVYLVAASGGDFVGGSITGTLSLSLEGVFFK